MKTNCECIFVCTLFTIQYKPHPYLSTGFQLSRNSFSANYFHHFFTISIRKVLNTFDTVWIRCWFYIFNEKKNKLVCVYKYFVYWYNRQLITSPHNIFLSSFTSYYYYLCEYVTSTEMRFIIPHKWTLQFDSHRWQNVKIISIERFIWCVCYTEALSRYCGHWQKHMDCVAFYQVSHWQH